MIAISAMRGRANGRDLTEITDANL
jgi:hypothetical protein